MGKEAESKSAEDVIAENKKNADESAEKFTAEFYQSVREEKARKLFPERGGDKYEPSFGKIIFGGEGKETQDKFRCESTVYKVLTKSRLVRIMLGALRSSGCEIDIRRHISCEVCDKSVTGGYDPFLNQVVICQNSCKGEGIVQGVLTHELIHMFDHCRRKMDLNNVYHLACTEIRAANLAHCSFMSAMTSGLASPFHIKKQHQECVKWKATASVLAVKDVTYEEAKAAVETVFHRCYNDLEPLGRRLRRNSDSIDRAYLDRLNMGYV